MDHKKLLETLGEIPENKKPIIERLVKDFCKWSEIEENLSKFPTYEVNPNNPKMIRKLPAHDMLKDAQQRTTELARAILRAIDGDTQDESPLLKMLKEYRDEK